MPDLAQKLFRFILNFYARDGRVYAYFLIDRI